MYFFHLKIFKTKVTSFQANDEPCALSASLYGVVMKITGNYKNNINNNSKKHVKH